MEEKIDPQIQKLYDEFKKEIKIDFDEKRLDKAFLYAYQKHKNQKRASGESYIIHPIHVARIVNQFYLDENSLIAALLHDVLEDTEATVDDINNFFGDDVLFLVEALTKISKVRYKSSEENQADNFRKMIVAMASDLRVILIKLADRLHNMRTICYLKEEKQKRIAKETLDIYAPIAHRLGIYWLKSELEDLSFKYLYPKEYEEIEKKVKETIQKKQEVIKFVENKIKQDMEEASIKCEVSGRLKHLYSIYTKMQRKRVDFDGIYDLLAVRIITESEKDCYAALGIIHKNYKPLPGRFKDYIALPKQNMYQSLHTTVFGPSDIVVEIQIRTKRMHEIAEEGIAAHYKYKENKVSIIDKHDKQFLWLRHLLKWQKEVRNPKEFLNTVKVDLFRGEVYVFTPAGDLKVLPRGATPVDFAYAIHTEVGNRCVGARVNGRIVPLNYKLSNGDIVEIFTQANHSPSKDWLKFVVTSKARSRIKQKVREKEKAEAIEIGKGILSKELSKINKGLQNFLKEEKLQESLSYFGCNSIDNLFEKIGFLKIHPSSVISRVYPTEKKKSKKALVKSDVYKIKVNGSDDIVFKLAKCCNPVYGDEIVGYITRNRGIIIHRLDCENVKRIGYDSDRLVEVEWDGSIKHNMPVKFRVKVKNKKGILARITNVLYNMDIDLNNLKVIFLDKAHTTVIFDMDIDVSSKFELERLIETLKKDEDVIDIERGKTYYRKNRR
ncbi:RelA/SpoT family protein [Hippea maritima]|uniref:(P)ppGpp synthetase I, SpoT/RelA n=1 Tax=Hippea maritima (strain ATCC 700847 / DSM 10411 / MH2) TaxID=760142 RepID=F2LUB5_HIPMA|nr:bifunctional (p)ppGpp synthetase/guanosine-3',5'-bis(diphosphate) 3'-pyrophosphohydrolase [Hippea maritima]AEA33441.1 (p)ppGpp synthetase I, SpoT/RelA [Hippea maritima DSM 10411]